MTAALAGWAVLVAVAVVWGHALLPDGRLNAEAPPFVGHYRLLLSAAVPGAVLAAAVVAVLPSLALSLPWRALLLLGWGLAAAWAVLLAVWDGHRSIDYPIVRPNEYLRVLPAVGDDPLGWLRGFTAHIDDYPVHVKGHPPLMVLVLWAWDHVGLSGGGWAAALVIGAGSSSVVAVALAIRAVADERAARAVLPFLVLGPFAITVATSADAFFLAVAAWSAAAFGLAGVRARDGVRRRATGWLGLGGLLAGALPYLSYGLLPFGAVLVAVAVLAVAPRRRPRLGWPALAATAAGLLAVPLLMTLGGFWWPDGVVATHGEWAAGHGDDRPYTYSLVADLAVLAVITGPATIAGAVSRPPRPLAIVAGAALLAVLVLDLSGVTRLEVERIWLPFAPWVMVTCAALRTRTRGWLALNALCAVAVQALVYGVW